MKKHPARSRDHRKDRPREFVQQRVLPLMEVIVALKDGLRELVVSSGMQALTPGVTTVSAADLGDLLRAVNAMEAAGGIAVSTWSTMGVPAPVPSGVILAQHIIKLRAAMNNARICLPS